MTVTQFALLFLLLPGLAVIGFRKGRRRLAYAALALIVLLPLPLPF